MSLKYTHTSPPSNPEDLPAYLSREFQRMSEVINTISEGHLDVVHVEPTKPREGDIRFASGTYTYNGQTVGWNPGNGKGLYYAEKHIDNQGVETYHWHHINHTN